MEFKEKDFMSQMASNQALSDHYETKYQMDSALSQVLPWEKEMGDAGWVKVRVGRCPPLLAPIKVIVGVALAMVLVITGVESALAV